MKMKKILSLFLTIAMLASMFTFVASAEGNAALFYDGAGIGADGNMYFLKSYCYTVGEDGSGTAPAYMKRNTATGDFDITIMFDFKITDYMLSDHHMVGFDLTPDMHSNMNYHFGYNFNNKAFSVYRSYMPGGTITQEYKEFARMSYDMPLNEWHEFAIRATEGKVFQMYLDGVMMLELDWDEDIFVNHIDSAGEMDWGWNVENRNSAIANDRWWLTLLDSDIYIDNFAVYSGDYNFGTGTASQTFCTENDFAGLNVAGESGHIGPFECSMTEACPFTYSANGGTEKVTYDRDFAANHTHEWYHDVENSSTAHCLVPGYDLYACECGATEQRNYVEPLGHLPGTLVRTDIEATENTTGVETRRCNRQGCMQTYKKLLNLTGETDKALHMITNGGSGLVNGYMSVPNSLLMVQDDGVTVVADIMPISQVEKGYTAIGATMGGCGDRYWLGYDFNLAKFVVKNGSEVIAESDKALNNYEWAEWMWHRDGYTVSLYIDGELVVTAELPEDTYTLTGDDTAANTQFFLFSSPACEFLIDNVIVSGPDYDVENRTGIIYDMVTFNTADYKIVDGFITGANDGINFMAYDKNSGAGYQIEAHGLPTEDVVEIHRDMALKVDSNYEGGSIWSYSQFSDSEALVKNDSAENPDGLYFEYSFDFYAYDWCTDEALLSKKVGTDEEGNPIMQTGSAFIGGHVNSNGNAAEGNGFIGYDFIRQQAVIGSVSEQAGGVYGENNVYADYAIEKDTWHRYTFKYDFDIETNMYVLSILIDGNEVLSQTTDFVTISYYIYFPNFVKGYQDNLTVKLGNNVLEENTDFTNGFGKTTASMDFTNGGDWSLAVGGVPTHVYEAQIFPASCDTDGYSIYSCSCGESVYTAYDQPHTGHAWDDGKVTVEPTTEAEGEMTFTCTACGDTYTETIEKLKPEFTYGDVNGDGKLQLSDLSALRRYIGGATSVSIVSPAADVNGDGKLQLSDVSTLGRKLGGANVTFGPAA